MATRKTNAYRVAALSKYVILSYTFITTNFHLFPSIPHPLKTKEIKLKLIIAFCYHKTCQRQYKTTNLKIKSNRMSICMYYGKILLMNKLFVPKFYRSSQEDLYFISSMA